MKRIILCFCVAFATFCNAQKTDFHLTSNGTFEAEEGKNYVIVEFEGKTAQELYTMVKGNILKLYKNPKNVMSENEPSSITIRAITHTLHSNYGIGGFQNYSSYYNLCFHFKDGRIKVDAPIADSKLVVDASGTPIPKTFVGLVGDWFAKDGSRKPKKENNIQKIEFAFVYPINYLLGYYKEDPSETDEDW